MLRAYINYPNPKVRAHRQRSCGDFQKMHKSGQRLVRIDRQTISDELQRFFGKEYGFAANATSNDMWLEIDFGDDDFEAGVLAHVHRLIGKHYAPLSNVAIETHC